MLRISLSRFNADRKLYGKYVFMIMALCLYSANTTTRWDAGFHTRSSVELCRVGQQWNFHYFQSGCSVLGGPCHVSALRMCKYVCASECVHVSQLCVLLFAYCVNRFCPCGFAGVHVLPKTAQVLDSISIKLKLKKKSHGFNLQVTKLGK